jgi:hypothetical protein
VLKMGLVHHPLALTGPAWSTIREYCKLKL